MGMTTIDANVGIRRAVDTGKVIFGEKQSEKSILKGKGQLIIISNNVPSLKKEKILELARIAGIPYYEFNGTGIELGSICGKPFVVSVMVVIDSGKSNVLNLAK